MGKELACIPTKKSPLFVGWSKDTQQAAREDKFVTWHSPPTHPDTTLWLSASEPGQEYRHEHGCPSTLIRIAMQAHREHKLLPYTASQLFDMVADVGHYPRFIPWCQGARVQEAGPKLIVADLQIGFGPFHESFTSHVELDRPREVIVRSVSGPLEHLSNRWTFTPVQGATRIDFEVDFQFKSHFLDHVADAMFHEASAQMMDAFSARAHALYGTESSP